ERIPLKVLSDSRSSCLYSGKVGSTSVTQRRRHTNDDYISFTNDRVVCRRAVTGSEHFLEIFAWDVFHMGNPCVEILNNLFAHIQARNFEPCVASRTG